MNTPDFDNTGVTEQQVKENVQRVFGCAFDPEHDWCTTVSNTITVNVPSEDVYKVSLLAYLEDESDDGMPYVRVLNEEDVNGASQIKMTYDAPASNIGIYIAYVYKDGRYVINKLGETNPLLARTRGVSSRTVSSRGVSSTTNITLPDAELLIGGYEESYAKKRKYAGFENDALYQMNDYSQMKITDVVQYDDAYMQVMRMLVFTYFPNGRKYNNLPKIKSSGYINENSYPITTGVEPIIVSPVYKNDGGYQEVENCDLYYYYFKESDVVDAEYIKALPKYKALPLNMAITPGKAGDDIISKDNSWALIYWGEGSPVVGETTGSFTFPVGYKIGFMLRSMTTQESGKKQGELYCDGRLNNEVNKWGNLKSSGLGDNDPRMAWLTVNGHTLLCCESGTDKDFNDLIIEVEGGIEPFGPPPVLEDNYYTFCFEDQQLGDYDMNDVVLKGRRINSTTVEWTLMACGATHDLYINNAGDKVISNSIEIHRLFGKDAGVFINTTSGDNTEYVVDIVSVPKDFSFLNVTTQPWLYDKTTNTQVKIATIGQDPHAIMIPYDFRWPLERICIKDAYLRFNEWGQSHITATDWYKYSEQEKVF